jgi:osmotically-inducible protein OsmY
VKTALQANSTLDSRHIDVAVERGEVHLKGFVQDNRTLLAAKQVATKAAGDRKIVNELIIKQNDINAP